jgi:endonuclease/exonuclease/phosphatase family metal-dependent hydrolase
MSTRLRLATWNIHKGIGTDRLYRLDRTIEVLKSIDADVVCLQEVDEGCTRSASESQVRRLGDALKYPHAALGLNVRVGCGGYGSAILSRHPLWDVRNVDLTVPPKKRRSGLVARIEHGPPGGWLLANVHLGLMHLERKVQVRRLLDELLDDGGEGPVVIAGDWNEWGSRLVHGVLRDNGFHLARMDGHGRRGPASFPSRRPLVALDRVLYREPARCHHVLCVRDEAAWKASDHLPIVVELETPTGLPPGGTGGGTTLDGHAHAARAEEAAQPRLASQS